MLDTKDDISDFQGSVIAQIYKQSCNKNRQLQIIFNGKSSI